MARPKTPNQKKAYNALNTRLNGYVQQVQSIYDELSFQMARLMETVAYDGAYPFVFADFPDISSMVENLFDEFVGSLQSVIYSGTSEEWKNSNTMQDLLAKKAMKYYDAEIDGERARVYFQTNSEALRAFQQRAEYGMNLSAKIWDQSENCKREMEYAISAAIEKGMSAVTLSKRLSQYLLDFPSLKADYEERYGHAVDCHDCEYRSIRLARSEINMAYRTAEQTRWRQFDFVVGYEVKLSGNHPREDICDALAGRYPKDFVWTGWHPNDMCYVVPIIMTEEEYWSDGADRYKSQVTDAPPSFYEYVEKHSDYIEQAELKGTLPYWLRDNQGYLQQARAV